MSDMQNEFSANMSAEGDKLEPFDVRDSSGRQGLVKLLVGLGVLLLLALLVLKLYQPGVRDRNDPPLITAENTPFKVAPVEPGGLQTPDQDKAVFDVMDGKTPSGEVKTAPQPETPIQIPNTANITVEKPVIKAPEPVNVAPAITPPKTVPRPQTSVAAGNSEWVVQIASVRSQADAGAMWTDVRRKYPSIVTSDFYADVRRVDLAEKGIFYRTRLAGLADKSAATKMCNALKAQGQACFVTRK